MVKPCVAALAAVLLWAGLAGAAYALDEKIELEFGGHERLALVHVPDVLATAKVPVAVVIGYHGGGGDAQGFREYSGLDAVADREGFIVVYPEGVAKKGLFKKRFHTWNAGECCGYAKEIEADDVGFTFAVLDALDKRHRIDRTRIFATGHSNGGMMSYRLAAEASDRVRAIAPVGGTLQLAEFAPSLPVPVLHIHSVDDPRALYEGGLGPAFPMTDHRVDHLAVDDVLAKWRTQNGCSGEGRVVDERRAPAARKDAGHTAERVDFGPCASGAPVVLWRMHGPGHPWPGQASLDFQRGLLWARTVGPPSAVIDAAEEAWAFFGRLGPRTAQPSAARRP